MKSYIELEVWIKSREMVKLIYQQTQLFPKEEIYGITSQIRRSAVSVPSNIAEGVGRRTVKDTIHFLYIAKGSLNELETQLYVSYDIKYISEKDLNHLLEKIIICKKLLNGFINYFKTKS